MGKQKKKNPAALKWLIKNTKGHFPLIFLLIILSSLVSSFSILFAFIIKDVINAAVSGDKTLFLYKLAFLLAIFIFQLIFNIILGNLEARVQAKLEILFRSKTMNSILTNDYMDISAYHSGELQNRLTSDVSTVSDVLTSFLPSLAGMLTRLGLALAALVVLDWIFAIVFLAGGLLLLIANRIFRPIMKRLHKRVLEADGKVRSFFQESIDSILMIKAFGIYDKIQERSNKLQKTHYKEKVLRKTVTVGANSAFSFTFHLGYLFALSWGAYHLLFMATTADFGSFTAMIQLAGQVQSPFAGLSMLMPQYYNMVASAERLMEIENLSKESVKNTSFPHIHEFYSTLSHIVFKDIDFRYDRNIILQNASFILNKGDFAVVSGMSGIGKSTLLKLLLGVIVPEKGEIYFDSQGIPYPADSKTRMLFAYVPQGNLLISGTIRETVSMVSRQVSEKEIINAAKTACAYDFISEFPNGLDTLLGEKGKGLSEGQMQRPAITRALLSDAPILLLDEATSALDEETEKQLLLNIKSMSNKTCIIISHKKAAFSMCNKNILLSDKSIITEEIKT